MRRRHTASDTNWPKNPGYAVGSDEWKRWKREAAKTWSRENRGTQDEYRRRAYWRRKLKVIAMLGGKCAGCGETFPLLLTINHVNGQGRQDRRELGSVSIQNIVQGRTPLDQVDLRCFNCQMIFEYLQNRARLPHGLDEFAFLRDWLEAYKCHLEANVSTPTSRLA